MRLIFFCFLTFLFFPQIIYNLLFQITLFNSNVPNLSYSSLRGMEVLSELRNKIVLHNWKGNVREDHKVFIATHNQSAFHLILLKADRTFRWTCSVINWLWASKFKNRWDSKATIGGRTGMFFFFLFLFSEFKFILKIIHLI